MAIQDVADQYFTYDARVASFHSAQKRRASNASSKGGKSVKWPHKFLSGDELAKAGFFFYPQPANPDNTACFLCHTALDGWEEGDDPLAEHLKHSSDCGWAIVATVEKQDGELSREYPLSSKMIEARKSTFAGKWPHDGKKGWKCKVKQMADAGWKYTPTPENDDMATCTYCALALDGWENSDKPMDEHFKRSPDCPFFVLIREYSKIPAPKQTKLKRDRTSKASRLSTQSALTTASETSEDFPAEEDDSILTTATHATTKRMGRAKTAPATKGRKTRNKKSEPIEVGAKEPEKNFDVNVDEAPKATRSRKRKSEEGLLEVTATAGDLAPPLSKRRATRTRGSTAVEDSITSHDEAYGEQPKPGRRRARPSRKVSTASVASMRARVPDDDEIDRALEADLERHVTDNEAEPSPVPVPKKTRASKFAKNHSMFDAAPIDIDEAAIDAELETMEVDFKPPPKVKGAKAKKPRKVSAKQRAAEKKAADMAVEASEHEAKENPAEEEASQQVAAENEHSISTQHSSPFIQQKKQRAPARHAPKKFYARVTRGSVLSVGGNTGSMGGDVVDHQGVDSGDETDASTASQSTAVRAGAVGRSSAVKKGKTGKKGLGGDNEEIVHEHMELSPATENDQPVLSAKAKRTLHIEEISVVEETYYNSVTETPGAEPESVNGDFAPKFAKAKAAKGRGRLRKLSISKEPIPGSEAGPGFGEPVTEEIPTHHQHALNKAPSPTRSSTPPPKEMTASQSPQSSDAENHPPSSKPSALAQRTSTPNSSHPRIPLSETTPAMSPSKRNIIAGLKSHQPWSMVDLDTIFLKSPSRDMPVTDIFGGAVQKIKDGELTSPEKRMTVEEWIKHNAAMAEEKLRSDCERMVGVFESEGTRAMLALEGVECLE
ncbi:unnamed protein product [Diplocarpon coronariae]